jgi:hypothetical protein
MRYAPDSSKIVLLLTDGKVTGSKVFLKEVFARNRKRMRVKRERGARTLRGLRLGGDWRTLTDLRGEVVL